MKIKEVIELFSALFGIFGAIYIFDDFKDRLIASLVILVIVLIIETILVTHEKNKINKDHVELQKMHAALAEQYRKKEAHLSTMQEYWHYLGYLFITIKQNKQIERLGSAFDLYAELSSKLNNEFTEE